MLYIVATPIGNWGDITDRAREILKSCDAVIGEEYRPTSTLLKKIGITNENEKEKPIYLLNEHTKPKEVIDLCELCAKHTVALVSDCGTPGFADPGPALVKLCRNRKVAVTALPGASSLTTLLSLTSEPIRSFVFFGFLPRETSERERALLNVIAEPRAWVIMDTPYRLIPLLEYFGQKAPKARALLGLNLTQPSELVLEGTFSEILRLVRDAGDEKAEFMLLRYDQSGNQNRSEN